VNTQRVIDSIPVGAGLLAKAIIQALQNHLIHRLTCFNVSAIKNASSKD